MRQIAQMSITEWLTCISNKAISTRRWSVFTMPVADMNNFNVIFLLTGGGPTNAAASWASGSVGDTDLLITWLFKITTGAESQYYLASVIGILVFAVVAVVSLVVYSLLPSTRNEEDFQ